MAMTRMIIFIALSIYLVLAGISLAYIVTSNVFDNSITSGDYETANQSIQGQQFNIMTNNTNLFPYFWISFLFVILPFILWIIIGISLFFPTGNAGA